jgi:hypothetical protein
MSKLRDLEKLLTHLENRTDRTDRSPFRQFCQSAPLDMQEVFLAGGAQTGRATRTTNGSGGQEAKEQKPGVHLETPTDRTDRSGAHAREPMRCAHCGEGERSGVMIVPFGTEEIGHTWLHSECWREWYTKRSAAAGAGEAR